MSRGIIGSRGEPLEAGHGDGVDMRPRGSESSALDAVSHRGESNDQAYFDG